MGKMNNIYNWLVSKQNGRILGMHYQSHSDRYLTNGVSKIIVYVVKTCQFSVLKGISWWTYEIMTTDDKQQQQQQQQQQQGRLFIHQAMRVSKIKHC